MNESEVLPPIKYLKEPKDVYPDCPSCPILSAPSQEETHIKVSNEKEYWKSIIAGYYSHSFISHVLECMMFV